MTPFLLLRVDWAWSWAKEKEKGRVGLCICLDWICGFGFNNIRVRLYCNLENHKDQICNILKV